VRVYLDTGPFIDYLSSRSPLALPLRAGGRKDRDRARLSNDAEECLKRLRFHEALTSAFTVHEAERTLFDDLNRGSKGVSDKYRYLVMSARNLSAQVLTAANYFGITVAALRETELRELIAGRDIESRSIRPADSLHIATARRRNVDLIVTGDGDLLSCDRVFQNRSGTLMRCVDTDEALSLL
jgi:predicted nucleic acid-binding protein